MKSNREAQNLVQNLERLSKLAKEHPGFINPDVLTRTMEEAHRILDENVKKFNAPVEDIDGLFKTGKGKLKTFKEFREL
ncbi:MAG: hypothetical protein ACTSUE_26945 [Promethearchaeota archaeon]